MAAWFVVIVPTAAYEQKLQADRDRNTTANQVLQIAQADNSKGFLSLAPVQESTLLQTRLLDKNVSLEPTSKIFLHMISLTLTYTVFLFTCLFSSSR